MKKLILASVLLVSSMLTGSAQSIAYNIIADWQVNADENNVLYQFVPVDQVHPTVWMNDPARSPDGNLIMATWGTGIVFNPSTKVISVDSTLFATASQGTKADSAIQSAGLTTTLSSYATSASVTSGLSGKFNMPTGTTAQYVRGDGSASTFPTIPAAQVKSDWTASGTVAEILNKPVNATTSVSGFMSSTDKTKLDAVSIKRRETYSGTSDGSGLYTVTFGTSYSVAPNIQANTVGQGTEVQSRIVSVSTTGFQVNVFQRVAVLTLALSTATTNVSGAAVDVLITEK